MPPSDTGGFGTCSLGAGARGGRARRGRPSGASAANQTTQPSSLSTLTADRAGEYIIYRAAGLGCLGSPAVFHKMRQAARPACARSRPSATLESMIAMSSITNEGAPAPLGRQEWAIVYKVPGTGLDAARAARGRFYGRFRACVRQDQEPRARVLASLLCGRACARAGVPRHARAAPLAVFCVPEGHRRARRPADVPPPYAIDAIPGRRESNVTRGLVPHPSQPTGPVPHVPRAHLVASINRSRAARLERCRLKGLGLRRHGQVVVGRLVERRVEPAFASMTTRDSAPVGKSGDRRVQSGRFFRK